MTFSDYTSTARSDTNRFLRALDIYGRLLSVVLLLLGLRQWAVIVGVVSSPGGPFETMSSAWQFLTMYLAVIDLVAAVGLWMRVSWGQVIWSIAALSEVAFYTIFAGTYGTNYLIVTFHLIAVGGLTGLVLLDRKERRAWPFHYR